MPSYGIISGMKTRMTFSALRWVSLLAVAALAATTAIADMAPIPRRHPPMRMPPLPRPPVVPPPAINVSVRDNEKPMTVARYAVDAQVNGLFATVSTTISFANPNGRVLEGELEFPLPEGASVCGYALDVNGRMREGVVVKKDEARIAFEAEVKAGVDPGIVEHVKGNLWKTRIYPIPANGSRTIRVDYVTPLVFGDGGDAAIQLPMPREKIAERKIDITVPIRADIPQPTLGGLGDRRFAKAEAVWRTSETDRDVTPGEDVVVALPQLPATFAAVEKTGSECWFAALAKAVAAKKEGVVTLLFTDGMDTLSGDGEGISLDALALVSGGEKDVEWLRLMCGGRVIDLATATKETVMREVYQPSRFVAGVEGGGVDLLQGIGQMAAGRVTILGRLAADSATIRIDFGDGVKSGPITLAKSDAKDGRTIACARAARRIAQLSPRADDNEPELLAIGREYGLASPKTSLIVLDTLAQYLKHKIEPPSSEPELHAEWAKRQPNPEQAKKREASAAASWLANLKRGWEERVAWHKNPVPKRTTPKSGLFNASEAPAGAAPADGAVADRAAPVVMASRAPAAAAMRVNAAAMRRRHPGSSSAPAMEDTAPAVVMEKAERKSEGQPEANASVKLAAWDPKTPYLQSLKDCAAAHDGKDAPADMLYRRYMELRAKSASSPAFYLDCAGFFFKRGEKAIAMRILSNLAEMKIEDPSLMRTFAWRLREAGEYDRAIQVLRKVAKLRPEEPHSFRDLALVLTERAKDGGNAADATEAMALLKKTAFTPWKRQNAQAVAVFALEELNALIAWCERNDWKDGKKPDVPELDKEFRYLIDVDVRIILSWDADNTDIDIHVLEPNGEEAYYQNWRTASGGFVSQDITTGYGPEEYLQLKGQTGVYKVLTHYYGSSQQKLTGPATATATVYTNWARPGEKRQILSLRLDKPKEKVTVGEIEFGK